MREPTMAERTWSVTIAAVSRTMVVMLPLLACAPAMADDAGLGGATARIEDLLKAGKLVDAEALGAGTAKSLAAAPASLSAADTVAFAAALNDLAYALAANRKVPDALVFMQQVVALRERVLGQDDPTLAA